MHRFLIGVLLVCSALVFSACHSLWLNTPQQIQVRASEGANLNTLTALDIVFVYDLNQVPLLPKTAPAWFDMKMALINSLATTVDVVQVQIPPATPVWKLSLPARHKNAVQVLAYANYISSRGQPVANLSTYKCVDIALNQEQPTYTECHKE